ncbi:hypothetical protein BOX15_Mlig026076g1 [Macrostomum lignano]|uniref:Homeobox domain-containing protein n=2 Tax=Macrostomum lignano TaxID=282301 RepID=A0A267FLF5_9PLAT|nr:hypothetical protein BOX15_Mlig026076g1 [Macrostomum lignano]
MEHQQAQQQQLVVRQANKSNRQQHQKFLPQQQQNLLQSPSQRTDTTVLAIGNYPATGTTALAISSGLYLPFKLWEAARLTQQQQQQQQHLHHQLLTSAAAVTAVTGAPLHSLSFNGATAMQLGAATPSALQLPVTAVEPKQQPQSQEDFASSVLDLSVKEAKLLASLQQQQQQQSAAASSSNSKRSAGRIRRQNRQRAGGARGARGRSHQSSPSLKDPTLDTATVDSEQQRADSPQSQGKTQRQNFTPTQNRQLLKWFCEHSDKPYPTGEDTKALSALTGLNYAQVKKWFANKRMRSKSTVALTVADGEVDDAASDGVELVIPVPAQPDWEEEAQMREPSDDGNQLQDCEQHLLEESSTA